MDAFDQRTYARTHPSTDAFLQSCFKHGPTQKHSRGDTFISTSAIHVTKTYISNCVKEL